MPLRRRRNHYQQLIEFERGRVVGLREGGFTFHDIAERLGRNVSTVHDCWQQWPRKGTASRRPGSGRPCGTTEREDRRVRRMAVAYGTASVAEIRTAVGTTVTQGTVTNWLLQGQLRDRHPVACIPLIPFFFLMKLGSALVLVMAVCWLEGGQVSACNQPVCVLDTLDIHLALWSEEQFPMAAGALSWLSHAP
ncbi:hypothetical protein AVEN_65520-1 [Araneus ventricosus]|uniref:Transposase IS30-like HTH domain-containing protein n=1 Tax=Araneus ventricosus TaxID=182803 RepID=A0A4Y2SZP3_ARAVE|nr:hypothetical protein AVEN_65520-1 [Araneus ventricosus]